MPEPALLAPATPHAPKPQPQECETERPTAAAAVPRDEPEASFLRAFAATPLVRCALERRGGSLSSRPPGSVTTIERAL